MYIIIIIIRRRRRRRRRTHIGLLYRAIGDDRKNKTHEHKIMRDFV